MTLEQKNYISELWHNILLEIRKANEESLLTTFEDLDEDHKKFLIDSIDEVIENNIISGKEYHDVWMKLKIRDGYTYHPVKDDSKKQHNCLVEFEDLNFEQQLKDDLFINTIHTYNNYLKRNGFNG